MKTDIVENKWLNVGVIGGIGPRASAHFLNLLIDVCSKDYHAAFDSDYPLIALLSLSNHGMTEKGEVFEKSTLLTEIESALNWFGKFNIGLVSIACNSIFLYYDEIAQRSSIKIINLPEEVATSLESHSIKKVAILGSQATRNSQFYDSYFIKRNIKPNYPNITIQRTIDKCIIDVMRGDHLKETTPSLLEVIDILLQENDRVLLACSELSVLVDPFALPTNTHDSMLILAEATLRNAIMSNQF